MKSLIILYLVTTIYLAFLSPHFANILENPPLAAGLVGISLWFPGIIGLIFAKKEGIVLKVFVRPNRSFFLGPLVILLLMALAFALSLPFVEIGDLNWEELLVMLGISYPLALTGSMLFSLGEELYWRGYLWEKLKKLGPIKAIVIIGVVWGVWHWPYILLLNEFIPGARVLGTIYPGSPLLGCLLLPFLTILLSFLFTYFRLKGKAIMVPAAMHGMAGLGISFAWSVYSTPSSFLIGMTGITSLIIGLLFCLSFKLFYPRSWKKLV